jgi:hypothetical protein
MAALSSGASPLRSPAEAAAGDKASIAPTATVAIAFLKWFIIVFGLLYPFNRKERFFDIRKIT